MFMLFPVTSGHVTVKPTAGHKRIASNEVFSDSEDEGYGKRHQENSKHKQPMMDEESDSIVTPSGYTELLLFIIKILFVLKVQHSYKVHNK